ncbi:MAG: acyl-CoA dehydrogenase family protein [Actinomycetota bacterium]
MIDLSLSPLAERVREMAHAFAQYSLRPVAREMDETGIVPEDLLKTLAAIGIGGKAGIPKELGGEDEAGRESSERHLISMIGAEELAWGDAGVVLNIPGPGLAGPAILSAGTPEQQERLLDRFTQDAIRYGALAVTESQAGSDVSGIVTRADRDGDGWVINGSKVFCTNGAKADIVVVLATVDRSLGRAGHKLFVVEKGTPGFTVGKIEKKMGLRASETAELILDDVHVPMDNLLGGEAALDPKGAGFRGTMKTFDATRPGVAALAIGIGRAAFEYARDWTISELPSTTPPSRRGAIDTLLATTERELTAARILTWRAAWMADHKMSNSAEASMAKAYAPMVARKACEAAIRIMGPDGYSKEHLVEKCFRDVKVYDIFEGTGQIQRVVISRKLLGRLEADSPVS